ncbi:hypothetical protein MP631_02395 [Xanthomonas phaseoli pv. phaseoli]|nr:hypothetical protein MP631_02395 [Xanthomonas phaseoli pv. phaseoli]
MRYENNFCRAVLKIAYRRICLDRRRAPLSRGRDTEMRHMHSTAKVLIGFMALTLMQTAAACCPDVGHTPNTAVTGLGTSRPAAMDLSAVSNAKVFAFERDGIRYLQVNDSTGQVRTAIGWIDNVVWVMPIGVDADRTKILKPGSMPAGILIYDGDTVAVFLLSNNNWIVIPKQ